MSLFAVVLLLAFVAGAYSIGHQKVLTPITFFLNHVNLRKIELKHIFCLQHSPCTRQVSFHITCSSQVCCSHVSLIV